MADKITINEDHSLNVSDNPIIPFIEGDGTGVDIWPAAKLVLDAAANKYGRTIAELSKGAINIQEQLVEKGFARIYERYSSQCEWSKNKV